MKLKTNATTREPIGSTLLNLLFAALFLMVSTTLTAAEHGDAIEAPAIEPAEKLTSGNLPETKSPEVEGVDDEVVKEMDKISSEKRKQLIKDAQVALSETESALKLLDEGKADEAIASLEIAIGKLDLIVARDPELALAPIDTKRIVRDLIASPKTAKRYVKEAEQLLEDGKVQQARVLLEDLASEVEYQVSNLPLATYPDAIKAIVPLIDDGKIEEAKTALSAAINTIVVQSYILPLPKIRAQKMLEDAEALAEKSDRSDDENDKLNELIEAARTELEFGKVLGYGTSDDFDRLSKQLDEIQKKTRGGKSGEGFFDRIKAMLKDS